MAGACGDDNGTGVETSPTDQEDPEDPEPTETADEQTMPDLMGLTERDATEMLEAVGISVFDRQERPSLDESGLVVDQHPSAGEPPIGTIIVTVAVPLPPMPDYAGKRIGDVRTELESWGVTVIEEPVLSTERPEDEVLATTPEAGAALGSEARLQVVVAPVIGNLGVEAEEVRVDTEGYIGFPETGSVDINGELYENSIYTGDVGHVERGALAYWEYDLGRDWEFFEATVGLLDYSDIEQRGRFRILVNGSQIWEEDVEFGEEIPISINISGGLRLRLEVVSLEEGALGLGWGSPRLLGTPGVAPQDG